ncbi:unnamed protein product [Durusdinium trenchii]|uniref:Uncharacterized protein n=3 Tax=Durusdinium trenchii TaxID=1381693 RepID=A0ABP0QU35_9DINO
MVSESGSDGGLCECLTVRSPRLLRRGIPRSRARGSFRVGQVGVSSFEQFVRSDVFHYMANMPLRWMLVLYCVVYVAMWLVFTFWWQRAASGCEERPLTFRRAFMLSLETMTTIGYGVADPMFDGCREVIPLLVVQSLISLLMDAIFLNMVYTRFSSAFTRSASIIFTDVAVVYMEQATVKLCFRVCEVARKPLIEPLIRVYLVKHQKLPDLPELDGLESDDRVDVEVHQMALEEPNINIADGKLFLTLPCKVVHCLDSDSPLCSAKNLDEFHEAMQRTEFFEVLAVLSGTCPITGNSLEARQSYTASDLRVDCRFSPCVVLRNDEHVVDFEYFHRTLRESWK